MKTTPSGVPKDKPPPPEYRLLSRELSEAREQQAATSEVLKAISRSTFDLRNLREVISAYQECVADIVQRFGGFVAKYMGDGVLIYFGYPQAHEDDAERAVGRARVGQRSNSKAIAEVQPSSATFRGFTGFFEVSLRQRRRSCGIGGSGGSR